VVLSDQMEKEHLPIFEGNSDWNVMTWRLG
jgi:hypothetical protein